MVTKSGFLTQVSTKPNIRQTKQTKNPKILLCFRAPRRQTIYQRRKNNFNPSTKETIYVNLVSSKYFFSLSWRKDWIHYNRKKISIWNSISQSEFFIFFFLYLKLIKYDSFMIYLNIFYSSFNSAFCIVFEKFIFNCPTDHKLELDHI